ncbi:MAG: hypothetical protein ACE5HU_10120, partial [Acidobacteriota bacterium]
MITRRAALGELTLFLVLAFSFIWLWAHTLITGLVIYALGLGLAITTHIIHHETPRELGLRIDNMGPAIKDAAVPVVPIVSSLLLYSFVSGHWSPRALDPQRFIELFCWAFFQQYLLQAFIHRRVAGLVGRPLLRQLLVGAIFASLHRRTATHVSKVT